jgi:periplasmic protein TonB
LFGLERWYTSTGTKPVQTAATSTSAPITPEPASTTPAPTSTIASPAAVQTLKPTSQVIAPDTVRSPNTAGRVPIVIASGSKPAERTESSTAEAPAVTISSAANLEGISLPGSATKPELEQRPQGVVTGGTLLRRVEPVYPMFAKQQRIQGDLVLSARVTKDGSVDRIKRVSGNPVLEPAAMAALRQWKYDPYKLNGQPQDVDISVTLQFRLKP